MRILLDECIPKDLCKSFSEHECRAAQAVGFGGRKNGELLKAAEEAGFEVLLTVDRNMSQQQNFKARKLALLVLQADTNKLADLLPLVPACLDALRQMKRGQVLNVSL